MNYRSKPILKTIAAIIPMRPKLLLVIKILIIYILLAMPIEASNLKAAQAETLGVKDQPQETLSTSVNTADCRFMKYSNSTL